MRDGWVETTLGELAEITTGSRAKGGAITSGIPSIGGEQIAEDRSIKFNKMKFVPEKHFESMRTGKLKFGDSLLVKDGATTGKVGYWRYSIPAAVNEHVFILRARPDTAEPYFINLLISHQSFRKEIESRTRGIIGGITRDIENIEFIVPLLPEQKRIVDLISSVDAYIEALQQQLESAKNSKSAYVNTIVSEIFARGKKTKIADIAEVKGGKRLPKGTPWSEEPTDHRYIRATDIKDGIILTENLVYVPDDVWPVISRYVVNQGDVVITIAGTIGQVGVIPASLDGVNLTENAAKIVVDKKLVRSNYLSMLLGSSYYQQDIDSKTKKTTQPKLGLNMINSIEIPLPDLAEQDEIFSVVSQIDTLIASTNDLIMQTITLRTGLLSDLLSGEHEIPASYDRVIGAA
jgi:restriction endonuclease S subunit